MVANPDLVRGYYQYDSDDGNSYQVGLAHANAIAGGFPAVPEGALAGYPTGWKMRHVSCTDGANGTTVIPVSSNTKALYKTGGPITKGSQLYLAQGRIGERMTSKK
jgi:hypothetical protein